MYSVIGVLCACSGNIPVASWDSRVLGRGERHPVSL